MYATGVPVPLELTEWNLHCAGLGRWHESRKMIDEPSGLYAGEFSP